MNGTGGGAPQARPSTNAKQRSQACGQHLGNADRRRREDAGPRKWTNMDQTSPVVDRARTGIAPPMQAQDDRRAMGGRKGSSGERLWKLGSMPEDCSGFKIGGFDSWRISGASAVTQKSPQQ